MSFHLRVAFHVTRPLCLLLSRPFFILLFVLNPNLPLPSEQLHHHRYQYKEATGPVLFQPTAHQKTKEKVHLLEWSPWNHHMDNRVQLTEGDPPDLANVSTFSSLTWPPNTCDMFSPHHSAFFSFAQWVSVAFCVRNLEEGRAMKVRQTWSLFVFDVQAVLGRTLFRSKIANCPFCESEIPKNCPSKSILV